VDDRGAWARLLVETSGERATRPQRIASLCVQMLNVSGAGISMVTPVGNRGVVCATDDVSARIEDLQFTLGEGPCVDAVSSGAPVLVADLEQPEDIAIDRWPAFIQSAADEGVKAIFAFPMRIGAISVGALDLYRDSPGDLTEAEISAGLLAADAAALALLRFDSERDDAFADDSEHRSTYQLQVHQATGMVQVQLGVKTEEAFLMLRARAFASGRSIADVAVDVVERRVRFSSEDR
jgi:GAF domain-containing protein